ncbi:MAG: EAL domain-containing protein [Burkholderiaceae bacterium]
MMPPATSTSVWMVAGALVLLLAVFGAVLCYRHRRRAPLGGNDPLTGFPLSDQAYRHLAGTLAGAASGTVVGVVVFDFNGLKRVNESLGRQAGDALLVQAAGRLNACIEPADGIARLHSDEFMAVKTVTDARALGPWVAGVIDAVGQPYEIDGRVLRLTINAGVTSVCCAAGHSPEPAELVRQATLAKEAAKNEGPDTFQSFAPDLGIPVSRRLTLEVDLRSAVENEAFELHFQPIVDIRTGSIQAVEALLRWPHPRHGVLAARSFIQVAEQTGQIVPLSHWVIDRACQAIRYLRDQNHAAFPMAVNVSPLHFKRPGFVGILRDALERYHLPAGALQLELTEEMLIDNADANVEKLKQIRELGVLIALDDFGTGYSSLSYLKRLPVDKLKIDQSFVQDVISDRRDATITKAIISLAHQLNVKVVAEGVETESQFWFLKRNFCDEVQGYLIARPCPLDQFSQLLFEQGGRVALPQPSAPEGAEKVLLLLDDEPNILRALSRLLRRDGYRILTANSPDHAFALLAENDVQVVVSDQRMPEMTGTEFFSRVKEIYPDTVRLILSGYTDLKSVTDAINRGSIYRFLTKPWDDEALRREVAAAFKTYGAQKPSENT